MAKILVTPVASSGVKPFFMEGETLTAKTFQNGGLIYYIAGKSFPAEIVKVLEGAAN